MALHGASAWGPCWCRPAVGATAVAPVQRRLGIHHAVGGSCPPGNYNSPQVNGWLSPSENVNVHTRLLSGGSFCQLTVSDMLLIAHRHLTPSTKTCFHYTNTSSDGRRYLRDSKHKPETHIFSSRATPFTFVEHSKQMSSQFHTSQHQSFYADNLFSFLMRTAISRINPVSTIANSLSPIVGILKMKMISYVTVLICCAVSGLHTWHIKHFLNTETELFGIPIKCPRKPKNPCYKKSLENKGGGLFFKIHTYRRHKEFS
jgi:hypothetical protein